jgi:hypothetical protein
MANVARSTAGAIPRKLEVDGHVAPSYRRISILVRCAEENAARLTKALFDVCKISLRNLVECWCNLQSAQPFLFFDNYTD